MKDFSTCVHLHVLLQDGCFGVCMTECSAGLCLSIYIVFYSPTKKRQHEWYQSTVERDRSAFSAEQPCTLTCTVGSQLKVGWAGVFWRWVMVVRGRVSSWGN